MGYLTKKPIAWKRLTACEQRATAGGCGALVSFLGVVRAQRRDGRQVHGLLYEAHPQMAERQIDRVVHEARLRWPLEAVHIQHRLGYVGVGQISLVVSVTAQHRAEAYAASQFLVEHLKHEVPIWKREHYDDGTSQWVTGFLEGSRAMSRDERSESWFDPAHHDPERAKRVEGSNHALV